MTIPVPANDFQELPRWQAVLVYRTNNGPIDVIHLFDEIEDLDGIIERGPHWDTLIRCTITRHHLVDGPITIEEAAEL